MVAPELRNAWPLGCESSQAHPCWPQYCNCTITVLSRLQYYTDSWRTARRPRKNFFIYHDVDDEEVKTYLCATWYGGDDDGSWVLLEPVEGAGAAGPSGSCAADADL